jgi:hypothetical protein
VERGNVKKWIFSAEERNGRWQMLDEKSKKQTRDGLGIPGRIAEPTGTDGFRLLSHQFVPSSLSRRENCIRGSKTFWLKMNKRREGFCCKKEGDLVERVRKAFWREFTLMSYVGLISPSRSHCMLLLFI